MDENKQADKSVVKGNKPVDAEEHNAFKDAPSKRKLFTVIAVYLGLFGNLMCSTSNSVMFPAAAAEIGGMDIYGLAQGISGILGVCAMPIFGFIGARNPAAKRWMAGGAVAVGALVLFIRGIAPNMLVIIAANFFWGVVSAGIFVIGYAMIRDMYSKMQAGVYLGVVGTVTSLGQLIGPFLGGFIIDNIGWRVMCFILCAILALSAVFFLVLGVRVTKSEVADLAVKGGSFDFSGAIALMVFLAGIIIVLSMGGNYVPFGSTLSNALIVVTIVSFVAIVLVVRKKKNDAIIPLNALKDRNTLVFASTNFLGNFGAMTLTFFIPGFIMRTLAADPMVQTIGPALAGGLSSTLMAILGLFLGPIFGRMIAKQSNAKMVMTIGNVFRIVIMAAFIFVLVPGVPLWVIYVLMFFAGVFNSQQAVTKAAGIQIQLKPELRTTGNSVAQLGLNLGAAVGTALFTLLVGADPMGGMRICMIIALAAFIVQFFITFLLKKADFDND